jgi:hypothetical protein
MIDLNYLGHRLKECKDFYPYHEYKCEICNIILYYEYANHRSTYAICSGQRSLGAICHITCEEFIIKSIIE